MERHIDGATPKLAGPPGVLLGPWRSVAAGGAVRSRVERGGGTAYGGDLPERTCSAAARADWRYLGALG